MGIETKKEFKKFIEILSKEICENILKNDIEYMINGFIKTEEAYKNLYEKYNKSFDDIKTQVDYMNYSRLTLKNLTDNLLKSNELCLAGLKKVDETQSEALEQILQSNEERLSEYKKNVQSLNSEERKIFLSALNKSIEDMIQYNLQKLSEIIDNDNIENIIKNTEDILQNIEDINCEMNDIKIKENEIKEDVEILNTSLEKLERKYESKLEELESKFYKQNKIIITMVMINIILCLIITFIK